MAVLAAILAPPPSWGQARGKPAQDNPRDRQMLTFYFWPSAMDEKMVQKYAADEIAKAKAAKRPILPRVALLPGMTLISLESVAICTLQKGCPLLVFRDMAKAPTLKDFSYQNVVIIYRPKQTALILTGQGADRECVIPAIATGPAKCRTLAKH